MLHSTTSDLLGSNEHGMAYRAPTAVNRAYAKVPIEQPRASVHVLVPTLTLRRPALEFDWVSHVRHFSEGSKPFCASTY